MILTKLPDRLTHGFLESASLHAMQPGCVRCYAREDFHTGFTLFSEDEQSSVFVQMYALPQGQQLLEKDLAFQAGEKKPGWGKPPKGDVLHLDIFPADWMHAAFSKNPTRIVHQYRGPARAVFIRYIGKSLKHPLLVQFNDHLRYLPDEWHTELIDREFRPSIEPFVPPAATVDTTDLRVEQVAIRKMILEAVSRFAAEQRTPDANVYKVPVTGIIVWFDVGNGYASVHFDVRAPFENDGSYSHQEYAALPRDNWRQFCERFYKGHAVTLTGLNGLPIKIASVQEFNLAEPFGQMILQLLQAMRTEKAFAPLLLAPGAELMIEADDFEFAWPSRYEDRGKENRI
jgi:hypothetical protein